MSKRTDESLGPNRAKGQKHQDKSRFLDAETASEVRDEYAQGRLVGALAREFGVGRNIILRVLDRRLYGESR